MAAHRRVVQESAYEHLRVVRDFDEDFTLDPMGRINLEEGERRSSWRVSKRPSTVPTRTRSSLGLAQT